MFKVSTVLVASILVSSVSYAQAVKTMRPTTKVKTGTATQGKTNSVAGKPATATQQAKEVNYATCSPREFAGELARRGQGDSVAIERQMKLIGVGIGMCSGADGGLLGKNAEGTLNYTDAQLVNLVKIMNQIEAEFDVMMEQNPKLNKAEALRDAEELAYAKVMDLDGNITAEEKANAKQAINAFRNHCKIFAASN